MEQICVSEYLKLAGSQIQCLGDAVSTETTCHSQERTEVAAKDRLHQRNNRSHVVPLTLPGAC